MIKSVIFDMDGLMVDTSNLWVKADQELYKHLGINADPTLLDAKISGRTSHDVMEIFKSNFKIETPVEEMVYLRTQILHNLLDSDIEIKTKPGLIEFIELLEQNSLTKAIATSTYHTFATKILEKTGLSNKFEAIVTGESVTNGKPAPDIFLAAAEMLGTRPEDCLVLEDAVNGIDAASAAGMKSIAIPTHGSHKDFTKANHVFNSLLSVNIKIIREL